MADDVKIPISTPGAKEAKAALDGVADSLHKVGDTAKRSGGEAAQETGKLHDVTGKLAQSVMSLVGSYAGLQGVLKLMQAIRQENEQSLQITLRQAEAMRGLLALSQVAGERPETQKALQEMAVASGRPIEQVAPAYYTLLGGTAGMTRDRQQGLMQAALTMSKTDYSADINSLVNLFSTIGTQNPDMSPQQISNLVSQTIEQAKSTPSEMAQYLPPILSTGRAAGVDAASLAAMFSFATRQGGGVATSGTAVRSTLLGVLAPPRETAKAMAEYGFPAGGSLMEKVGWLGSRGKDLPEELLAAIGGRRGIEAVAAISADPAGFAAEIAAAQAAMASPQDLMAGRLQGLYGEMPAQRMLDQIKQTTVATEIERNSPELQRADLVNKFRELRRHREGQSQIRRIVTGRAEEWYTSLTGENLGGQGASMEGGIADYLNPLLGLRRAKNFGATDQGFESAQERLLLEGYGPPAILDAAYSGGLRRTGDETWYEAIRARLGAPMQGATYSGGTHYHNENKNDPAGKPAR